MAEAQGKILFKRTDIRTMKKDIKMLREFDTKKEQAKTLEPLAPTVAPEMEKQHAFALKSEVEKAKIQITSLDTKGEELEKKRWEAQRNAAEAKKRMDELEAKNRETEAQKAVLQQKIAQTNDTLSQVKSTASESKVEPVKAAPAAISENDQRKKFMEDIEAWANSDKKIK